MKALFELPVTIEIAKPKRGESYAASARRILSGKALHKSVTEGVLAKEIAQARVIVKVISKGSVIGIGVIKRDRPEYAAKVAKRCGAKLPAGASELGYLWVHEAHRNGGLVRVLVTNLVNAHDGPALYAVASTKGVHDALYSRKFRTVGNEWRTKAGKTLAVMVRK